MGWRDDKVVEVQPQGLLPIDEARAQHRENWVDYYSRMRSMAEEIRIMPEFNRHLEKFGGLEGAIDHLSSDYYFGMTPMGRKYKEAGLLGEGT